LIKLRQSIQEGVDALERGDYIDVEDKNLDAFLDSLVESKEV
jgi:hypothetical protein